MRTMSSRFAGLGLLWVLSACGGGGGSSIREVPFSEFSSVQSNTTVVMSDGISTTASGTATALPGGATTISIDPPVDNLGAGNTQKLTYDGSKALSGMSFSTPGSSASFSRSAGFFECSVGVCQGISGTGTGVVIDGVSSPLGWNYQTFGVWEHPISSTAFQAGAISAGTVTPASGLPTIGSATFIGLANAFYVNAGTPFFVSAQMSAMATWTATPSIAFSTSGTQTVDLNSGAASIAPQLNLNGTLIYNASVNRFSGGVSAPAVGMNGTATGRFYGPAAQEIGGVFSLTGSGQTMLGGFGGRQ
jgi:transferrin binding protein